MCCKKQDLYLDIKMFHVKRINEMEYARYTSGDFRENEIIGANCIQYVLDNVEDFEIRYPTATRDIRFHKKDLKAADEELFNEICGKVGEFLSKNGKTCSLEQVQDAVRDIFG